MSSLIINHPLLITIKNLLGLVNIGSKPICCIIPRQLKTIFAPLHDQGRIEFHSLGNTTLNDIHYAFNRFHNRIVLFHYGGHSDEGFLHLEDTGARSNNLATLMGIQDNLALVCLNGCKNSKHVHELFNKGVKTVIATKANIKDNKALLFSKAFYENLVSGLTMKESFDSAEAMITNDNPDTIFVHRGFNLGQEILIDENEWELNYLEEQYTQWVIPQLAEATEDSDFEKEVSLDTDLEFNKELVYLAFEGLIQYSSPCKAIWDLYQQNPTSTLFINVQRQMLSSYPSALTDQLGDLFASEGRTEGRLRLKELNEAFLTLLKLLSFISLADFWNTLIDRETDKPKSGFIIRPEYKKVLQSFLELNASQNIFFDYGWLLGTIRAIFQDNKHTPFIKESDKLLTCFSTCDEYYLAYQYLEQELRNRLIAKNINKIEVKNICLEAEKQLGILLRTCGFLSAYQFVTVKDIGVNLPQRVKDPTFKHNSSILIGARSHIKEEFFFKTSYTSNNSIVLTKDISTSSVPLNLSPFVIDENAYKKEKEKIPNIFFFKGWGTDGSIHFEGASRFEDEFIITKEIDTDKYEKDLAGIRVQLLHFKQDLGI